MASFDGVVIKTCRASFGYHEVGLSFLEPASSHEASGGPMTIAGVRTSGLVALLAVLLVLTPRCGQASDVNAPPGQAEMAAAIPSRAIGALSGSQFAEYILGMDSLERELVIRDEILNGNVPDFLRKLVPVKLRYAVPGHTPVSATIFVTPDYLSIGSDSNFLRFPMNLYTAEAVASRFGFILPTKKIVDAIYAQSSFHLVPQPMTAGPQMRSTEYYRTHNQMIEDQVQAQHIPLGELIAGHKKDVVVTNRLAQNEGRIAIYGWHRDFNDPIQPLVPCMAPSMRTIAMAYVWSATSFSLMGNADRSMNSCETQFWPAYSARRGESPIPGALLPPPRTKVLGSVHRPLIRL